MRAYMSLRVPVRECASLFKCRELHAHFRKRLRFTQTIAHARPGLNPSKCTRLCFESYASGPTRVPNRHHEFINARIYAYYIQTRQAERFFSRDHIIAHSHTLMSSAHINAFALIRRKTILFVWVPLFRSPLPNLSFPSQNTRLLPLLPQPTPLHSYPVSNTHIAHTHHLGPRF